MKACVHVELNVSYMKQFFYAREIFLGNQTDPQSSSIFSRSNYNPFSECFSQRYVRALKI